MQERRVFVTRQIPEPGLEVLRAGGARITVGQTREDAGVDRESLLGGVRDCDVLLPLLTEAVDHALLSANPTLLGVAQMAVGYNNIDVDAATALGIPVSNTPGVLTETTADLAWALILSSARKVPQAHRYMVEGRYKLWGPNLFLGDDVGPGGSGNRKVLGVIGFGRIGQAVAKRAIGFDMDVIAYDPHNRDGIEECSQAEWSDLDPLLERSDFVTLHTLLTPETRYLIDEAELRRMKSTAHLINTARGPVVNEAALVRALNERWIAGAGLDVFEDEPAMADGLSGCDTAVLLPHIASASSDTRGLMASMAARNALAHLDGARAPNVVNPEVYDTEAYRQRTGSGSPLGD